MLFRRILSVCGSVCVLLAVNLALAGPASAEIQRCRGPVSYVPGITFRTCITVGVSVAEAWTRVSYNVSTRTKIDLCTIIHRDSQSNDACITVYLGPGVNAYDQKLGAGNPPGTQRWYAETYILRNPSEPSGYAVTETILDT